MRVLIACEYSGRVREAFRAKGHDAWSCDLLPSEDKSRYHMQRDAIGTILSRAWDLVISHPPCTHLCNSGSRWWKEKRRDGRQEEAIAFFRAIANAPFNHHLSHQWAPPAKWCIENPIGIMSTHYRKPDQIIQPWQFGHGETKATCLWLSGLPKLTPTNIVEGREPKCHWMPPSKDRWKERSRTYQGIADAMAEQWGNL